MPKGMYQCSNDRSKNPLALAMGSVNGLETLKFPCKVKLYSDSRYLVDAIVKGWVKRWKSNNWYRNKQEKASNVDLWKRLLIQLEKHEVQFIWVKGHASNPENNRCDQLARTAIKGTLEEDIRQD